MEAARKPAVDEVALSYMETRNPGALTKSIGSGLGTEAFLARLSLKPHKTAGSLPDGTAGAFVAAAKQLIAYGRIKSPRGSHYVVKRGRASESRRSSVCAHATTTDSG